MAFNGSIEPIYGDLPNNWRLTCIGELEDTNLANLQTGPFGTMLHASSYVPFGTPVVAVKNIGDNRLLHNDLVYINEDDTKRLEKYRLLQGDIIFGRKGAVDRRAYVGGNEEDWIQGSDCIRLRLEASQLDSKFISYVFGSQAYVEWITRNAQGATMPSLNQKIIRRVPIPHPPLSEQRAIAYILGGFDDKIELNREMNRTLEAMARAIFKAWFVDFDPVRAKQDGQPPAGMDADTAALFPASFVDSALGPVPEGWRVEPIGQHVEATKGLSYKGKFLADEGIPLHNLNSIYEGGGYKHEGMKYYNGDYKERHIAKAGDLIVANTEQTFDSLLIGYSAIIPERYGDSGLFTHHLYRVRTRTKSPISSSFVYFLLRTQAFHRIVSGYANGTTVNMLPRDALEKPSIVVPPKKVVERFEKMVEPMMENIELNYEQGLTLAELRDTLLPKLISGAVRVPAATERLKDS